MTSSSSSKLRALLGGGFRCLRCLASFGPALGLGAERVLVNNKVGEAFPFAGGLLKPRALHGSKSFAAACSINARNLVNTGEKEPQDR